MNIIKFILDIFINKLIVVDKRQHWYTRFILILICLISKYFILSNYFSFF
jgi:hypothetical protein